MIFLVPGVSHCAGGPGADGFWAARLASAPDPEHDMLLALVRWVEQGVAPSRIVASKFLDDEPRKGVAFQRPPVPVPGGRPVPGQRGSDADHELFLPRSSVTWTWSGPYSCCGSRATGTIRVKRSMCSSP